MHLYIVKVQRSFTAGHCQWYQPDFIFTKQMINFENMFINGLSVQIAFWKILLYAGLVFLNWTKQWGCNATPLCVFTLQSVLWAKYVHTCKDFDSGLA